MNGLNCSLLGDHDWIMVETGYEHYWNVEIQADGSIVASDERNSETGAGDDHLWCRSCGQTRTLEGVEVEFE